MPTTMSLRRGRFAFDRLAGLEGLPRSGTPAIYREATDKRIREVLDHPPPKGLVRWNGRLVARMLGDVDVRYVWRSLRKQKIDLAGRKIWCESNIRSSRPKLPMWSACIWPQPRRWSPL